MNGAPPGTSGERRWLITGWAICAAIIAGVAAVNVISITHEAPQYGLLEPLVWEISSALGHIAWMWLPWLALRWSLGRPRWQAAIHVPAALAYSALHVTVLLALRKAAYAADGAHYDGGPLAARYLYELRKDVLAYLLMVAVFWLVRRLRSEAASAPSGPAMFDIRDGARLVRAPLADILAVTSAGNYAEFVLADGRRPLMRASLASLEGRLPGFVRTHRSWLVNAAKVTGLRPEGSGDYAVEVGALEVPLSRRFPAALARLRQG